MARAAEEKAKRPERGKTLKVVRGRKVPLGTTGMCIWRGSTKFGERVGLKDEAGNVHWTALANVEVVLSAEKAEGIKAEVAKTCVILWDKAESIDKLEQTSYYDISTYKVPVDGKVDIAALTAQMREKFPQGFNNFGGYSTCESVTDNGDGTVNVRMYYHIGE